MSDSNLPEDPLAGASRDEMTSILFANMVLQQTQMVLMLLGKVPHPESGRTVTDLEGARMFIDQMEMLAEKTQGNLNKQEETLLKQSLTTVRMAFVEAVDRPGQPAEKAQGDAPPSSGGTDGPEQGKPTSETSTPDTEAEARKKFTKKY
jgi:hypothetical protein